MHSLCCVEIFSLPPRAFLVEDTSHASLVPAISSKNRQFSWIHITVKALIKSTIEDKSKQNYSFLSGCLQSIFFVMDANHQPLRYFAIKSIFSASRPTTPILCFCTTKEEASHGGWKTCNDPTHQQHSMVWGSENIISLTAKVQTAGPQDNDDVNLQAVSARIVTNILI